MDDCSTDSERRRRRSDDPITALHYQLAVTRSAAEFEAVVLVDETGCLVAGAGAWPACEELAAYAPLLAEPTGIGSPVVSERIRALSAEVEVQEVLAFGARALLCGRAATPATRGRKELIARAAKGCSRILATDA